MPVANHKTAAKDEAQTEAKERHLPGVALGQDKVVRERDGAITQVGELFGSKVLSECTGSWVKADGRTLIDGIRFVTVDPT